MAHLRFWHGRVPIHKADDYERFMIERAAPDYASVKGLLALSFNRRDDGEVAHFMLVTQWESLDAVKAFAGADFEAAKYYPEDDRFLLEQEQTSPVYRTFFDLDR